MKIKLNSLSFDWLKMEKIHRVHEDSFLAVVMEFYPHAQKLTTPDGRTLIFVDNGADTLAVAHLDGTLEVSHFDMGFNYVANDWYIHSLQVDDRLGTYVLLDLLPQIGVQSDLLFTVGEETGDTTAQFFRSSKQYNWIYQFDRGGTDAVHYQYTERPWLEALTPHFGQINRGSFSDIHWLGHLGCSGVNIGTAYYSYTGHNAWASLTQLSLQVKKFERFYNQYKDQHFPHAESFVARFKQMSKRQRKRLMRMGIKI